jgi:biopolymer transport protein ExbD
MPMILIAAAMLQAVSASSTADDVVVVARRRKCDLRIAKRMLSDREFTARAAEWAAGKPVRIVMDETTGYRCMAKVLFRLSEHGVTNAEFVDSVP